MACRWSNRIDVFLTERLGFARILRRQHEVTIRQMNAPLKKIIPLAMACLLGFATMSCGAAEPEDRHALAHAWQVRRGPYFERAWGIDIVGVRLTSSNWMLEFKYRVVDPKKAKSLLARNAKPYLTDEASGAKLAVPAMENIGELRQAAEPVEGRTYYIIFGNASRIVKAGNRVIVDIGALHADGLIVE